MGYEPPVDDPIARGKVRCSDGEDCDCSCNDFEPDVTYDEYYND
jgi:hypothetical protein